MTMPVRVDPPVVVRHQAAVVEGTEEIHDAVPDEEDGEVPGDVLLVAQRRGEAVLDQVVKEYSEEGWRWTSRGSGTRSGPAA